MATTVALTGASGFIGGAIAHYLCHEGYSVQALVRSPQQAKKFENDKQLYGKKCLGTLLLNKN